MRALGLAFVLACLVGAGSAVAGGDNVTAPDLRGKTPDEAQNSPPDNAVDHYTYIHVGVYKAQHAQRRLLRADLKKLIGLTVDQAKAQLKAWGHDGAVNVAIEQQFIKKCGVDKVCKTQPDAMGIHEDITLFVNPKLKITAPPP